MLLLVSAYLALIKNMRNKAGWQYALKFHGATWHGNYGNKLLVTQ
jgi:hypothetical protein